MWSPIRQLVEAGVLVRGGDEPKAGEGEHEHPHPKAGGRVFSLDDVRTIIDAESRQRAAIGSARSAAREDWQAWKLTPEGQADTPGTFREVTGETKLEDLYKKALVLQGLDEDAIAEEIASGVFVLAYVTGPGATEKRDKAHLDAYLDATAEFRRIKNIGDQNRDIQELAWAHLVKTLYPRDNAMATALNQMGAPLGFQPPGQSEQQLFKERLDILIRKAQLDALLEPPAGGPLGLTGSAQQLAAEIRKRFDTDRKIVHASDAARTTAWSRFQEWVEGLLRAAGAEVSAADGNKIRESVQMAPVDVPTPIADAQVVPPPSGGIRFGDDSAVTGDGGVREGAEFVPGSGGRRVDGGPAVGTIASTRTDTNPFGNVLINLSSENDRIRNEIAMGRLTIEKARLEMDQAEKIYLQQRHDRLDREQKRQFGETLALQKRTQRLSRDTAMLSASMDRQHTVNQATLGAVPYLAPRTEFLPGQGPGGAMQRLSEFSGADFTPVRTADVTHTFDPDAIAEQALREFEARSSDIGVE
jgi:hypothetical protein